MKPVIFALLLVICLSGFAIWSGFAVTEDCDRLLYALDSPADADVIAEKWESFMQAAAFVTPYDLIRTANSACENYCALVKSDANAADVSAARKVLIAALREIRRVHTLSWELIF